MSKTVFISHKKQFATLWQNLGENLTSFLKIKIVDLTKTLQMAVGESSTHLQYIWKFMHIYTQDTFQDLYIFFQHMFIFRVYKALVI